MKLKDAFLHGDVPVIAADVPSVAFDQLTRSSSWVTDEEAWKVILSSFPTQHIPYAHQVREAVAKRKEDGLKFVILFAVREEKPSLLVF